MDFSGLRTPLFSLWPAGQGCIPETDRVNQSRAGSPMDWPGWGEAGRMRLERDSPGRCHPLGKPGYGQGTDKSLALSLWNNPRLLIISHPHLSGPCCCSDLIPTLLQPSTYLFSTRPPGWYPTFAPVAPVQFSSVAQSCLTLQPHRLQHARPPCPSPTPGACSHLYLSSQWCHPTVSSSVIPFSSCLQSFPASGSFQMSQFFASGGQSIGASASASVLPMNIQDWFPLGLTSCCGPIHLGFSPPQNSHRDSHSNFSPPPLLGVLFLTTLSGGILPDSTFPGALSLVCPSRTYHLWQMLADLHICLLTTCLPLDTSSTQTRTTHPCLGVTPPALGRRSAH